jgi:RHS repeat-associated protein
MTLHLADGSMAAQRKADYNGLGLPRQTRTFVGVSDSDPTQLLYDITDNRYDPLGRIWAQASPYRTGDGPQWTVVSRDALGRITRTQAPDGSETHAHYDERAQLPDALADLDPAVMGRTTRLVDAWGRERWTWHNALGQLQIAIEPNPDGNGSVFAPGTAVTYYGYNALDQVTSIFQLSPGSTGQNRWFRYDGLGRLTHQWLTERGFTLSDAGQYRVPGSQPRWSDVYSYVDRTRLAWHMDARGVKTRLDYGDDPLGRLQSITYEQPVIAPGTLNPQPPPQPASAVRYAYVTTGDLTRPFRVTTDDVTRQYGYDNEGRLATVSMTLPDRPKRPFALDYRYDTAHRIHQIIYPAGYGLPGAPRKHVELEYDPGSRIQRLAVDGVAHAAEISYSPHGWPTELTIGPDSPVPIAERNDPTPVPGLLARQQVLRDGETLLDLSYQYTRPGLSGTTGQLTRATDNLNPERTITYEYDAAARLRQASGGTPDSPPLWTQHYSYDRYGNRTAVTASGTTLDGAPMPADGISGLEFGRLIPNGLRRNDNRISTPGFAYDEAGNLVRGQRQDGEWQRYRYDAAGRLITVTDEVGTPLETYTYGACRRRVRTRDERAGTSLCHIWHGNSVVAEYHGDSPQTPWVRSFVYLEDRLLCTFAPANRQRRPAAGLTEVVRYHHPDRLGTRLITTPETQDVIELTTLPYGTQLIPGPQPHEGAIFTSYRRSDVTQLDYAVNRDYDPWLARFIQPDPLRLQAIRIGEPQSNNAYTYSAGDPINRVDPTGLKWIEGVWIDDDALIGDEIVVVGHLTPGRAGDSPDENAAAVSIATTVELSLRAPCSPVHHARRPSSTFFSAATCSEP